LYRAIIVSASQPILSADRFSSRSALRASVGAGFDSSCHPRRVAESLFAIRDYDCHGGSIPDGGDPAGRLLPKAIA
jgi:hypothetical protein